MAKFVYLYTGGSGMPESPEAQAEVMQAWTTWLNGLGDTLVDVGNPFGASAAVLADGSTAGASTIGGYTVITAESLDDATTKAKGSPQLAAGGSVEIFEALEM